MHRTKIGIVTLAAASVVLVGCGGADDPTTAASSSSTPAPEDSASEDDGGVVASGDLVDWAAELCGAIRPIEDKFSSDEFSGFQPTDPSDPQATIDQFRSVFGGVGPIFDDAYAAVEAAGPPPIDGGDAVYANMLTVLQTTADAFGQIDDELANVDPTDPNALESLTPIFASIGSQLQSTGEELNTAFAQPEMTAAIEAAPECDGLDMTSS